MDIPLADRDCLPGQATLPKLTPEQIEKFLPQLDKWYLNAKRHLFRSFTYAEYDQAVRFVRDAAELAQQQYHHPTLSLAYGTRGAYGRVGVEIWTHKQGALTENDFILAAKIDRLHRRLMDSAVAPDR